MTRSTFAIPDDVQTIAACRKPSSDGDIVRASIHRRLLDQGWTVADVAELTGYDVATIHADLRGESG